MSRSRNTEKISAAAERKIRRDQNGEPCLPRIVARRPRRGDDHPMSKSVLTRALRDIPIEYLYGLKRIELRARSSPVGEPFGYYSYPMKFIVLYSLPRRWTMEKLCRRDRQKMEAFGAEITQSGETFHVHWPSESGRAVWFFTDTVMHELGHHFAEQYRKKLGRIGGRGFNEMNAELHAFRLTRAMIRSFMTRRRAQAPDRDSADGGRTE